MRAAVGQAINVLDELDILVNNAGIGAQGGVEANPDDEWRHVLDVKRRGTDPGNQGRAASVGIRPLHADVWPGVLAALRRAHVSNYSIYLRDGLLFSYLEYTGSDYTADMASGAADPETRRWWLLTEPCQRPVDTAAAGELWAPLTEVFHLD